MWGECFRGCEHDQLGMDVGVDAAGPPGVGGQLPEVDRQYAILPLLCGAVRLAVQLTHGDGLGVDHAHLDAVEQRALDALVMQVGQGAGKNLGVRWAAVCVNKMCGQ